MTQMIYIGADLRNKFPKLNRRRADVCRPEGG